MDGLGREVMLGRGEGKPTATLGCEEAGGASQLAWMRGASRSARQVACAGHARRMSHVRCRQRGRRAVDRRRGSVTKSGGSGELELWAAAADGNSSASGGCRDAGRRPRAGAADARAALVQVQRTQEPGR